MARPPRIIIAGYPHHITQRGNNKQPTFKKAEDYRHYLAFWTYHSKKNRLSTLAFNLMPNHIHFITVPNHSTAVSNTLRVCQSQYSQHLNKKYGTCGHLWHSRFYSTALDERHLYEAIRYVENNPVEAQLVNHPEEWPWSSAAYHLEKGRSPVPLLPIEDFLEIADWRAYLNEKRNEEVIKTINQNSSKGKPSGGDMFEVELEIITGITFPTRRRGRPYQINSVSHHLSLNSD